MPDIQRIDFHGDEISTCKDEQTAKVYCIPREISTKLGTNWSGQYTKLTKSALYQRHTRCLDICTPGGMQEVLMLDIEYLPAWLGSISLEKVDPSVREKLIAYQEECAKALRDYWTTGVAINPRLSAPDVPALPAPKETLDILYSCRMALQDLGCFDDRDSITFAAYVRRIAATAMQPLLPPGTPDPTAPDLSQPVLWTLSMRLQYLKYPPLSGTDADSKQIRMGSMAVKAYKAEFNEDPKKLWDFVRGQQRQVNAYAPDRVHVLDQAIAAILGPPRLQVVTTT